MQFILSRDKMFYVVAFRNADGKVTQEEFVQTCLGKFPLEFNTVFYKIFLFS